MTWNRLDPLQVSDTSISVVVDGLSITSFHSSVFGSLSSKYGLYNSIA